MQLTTLAAALAAVAANKSTQALRAAPVPASAACGSEPEQMRARALSRDDARRDISAKVYVHFFMETGSAGDGCALRAERAAWPSRGVVMNSGVERRAERLGDARALVLLDDEGRRQDEDVAEARHRRRVAADDDAGVRAAPHDGAARVII